uniref:Protein kinase domain-containing protein n=1 Tax=Marseillevirus LCMAC201 TaxID=2506605 RepID=A0A481YWP3_9VIRU|nr:MAG: hypothetical protein LCMAC201_02210 [Marseillevirus LCMAC201]
MCDKGPGAIYTYPPEMCLKNIGVWTYGLTMAHDIWSLGITLVLFYKAVNRDMFIDFINQLRQLCLENYKDVSESKELLEELCSFPADVYGSTVTFEELSSILCLMLEYDPVKRLQNWNQVVKQVHAYYSGKATMKSGLVITKMHYLAFLVELQ